MNSFQIDPNLKRYPVLKRDLLQAWDSADDLILEHLNSLDLANKRILILGDQFGALGCALQQLNPTSYTDSYLSFRGAALNSKGKVEPLHDLSNITGLFDLAIIQIPKNMSFFEDQLCHLSQHLKRGAPVICGYRVKHYAKASFEHLEKIIGNTTTSLIKKKARLIFSNFEREPSLSPYPIQITIPGFTHPFSNSSNLFSREKLDIGTRFLLDHLPEGHFKTILDLGCANGIIGIAAKSKNPSAQILFSDESQMAIQSAQANYAKYFSDRAQFHWTHCLENIPSSRIDLILCNPPFHQGTTLGSSIAQQMFMDSKNTLAPGGRLRVIGNHHLQYPNVLHQIFGKTEIIAQNSKFVIVDALV